LRAVAKIADLSDAVVTERVERFWAHCKYLLSARSRLRFRSKIGLRAGVGRAGQGGRPNERVEGA